MAYNGKAVCAMPLHCIIKLVQTLCGNGRKPHVISIYMKIIIETTPKKGKKIRKDLEQLADKHHVQIEYTYNLEEIKDLMIKYDRERST
jgi:hypothetical protein